MIPANSLTAELFFTVLPEQWHCLNVKANVLARSHRTNAHVQHLTPRLHPSTTPKLRSPRALMSDETPKAFPFKHFSLLHHSPSCLHKLSDLMCLQHLAAPQTPSRNGVPGTSAPRGRLPGCSTARGAQGSAGLEALGSCYTPPPHFAFWNKPIILSLSFCTHWNDTLNFSV